MKRNDLICHLKQHKCELLREGYRHCIRWNPKTKDKTAVPHHREINEILAKKICKDLSIPSI
ncbi:addiction module toxin, HicA family [Crocosphaera sp. Alani8]|uniref:addiction module toxin, HicA family n=1 Tax=Crocosphaera sp. Alani8 TaxID=3038952 RepID=UPI00313EF8F9